MSILRFSAGGNKRKLQMSPGECLSSGASREGWSAPASVYRLKGWYLRLNTPLFPVHFRAARAAPDIAFKVAPHATLTMRAIIRRTLRYYATRRYTRSAISSLRYASSHHCWNLLPLIQFFYWLPTKIPTLFIIISKNYRNFISNPLPTSGIKNKISNTFYHYLLRW